MNMKRNNTMICASYGMVYLVWGSTYYFIKVAVETIPPMLLVALRWGIGGLVFLVFYYVRHGYRKPALKELAASFMMGMLLIFIPNTAVSAAERRVDSYIAALILSAAPIAVAFFDRFLLGRKVSAVMLAGMLIGVSGVAMLVYDGNSLRSSLSIEVVMLLGVVAAFSFGTSIGHKVNAGANTVMNTGYQMALSGFTALAWVALFHPQQLTAAGGFSLRSLLSTAYLATAGSAAYGAYNYLVRHEPAAKVASYALVNPLIAVFIGIVVGGESPARYMAAGVTAALAGLSLMMYGERISHFARAKLGLAGLYAK